MRLPSGKKKIICCVTAFMMLFFVLSSFLFIAVETHHHCTGEDCPVCISLQQCSNILKRLGGGIAVAVCTAVAAAASFLTAEIPHLSLVRETPVSQKIRMND